ncbi:MAG: molybdenum cofactor biosynthesis protein MoaE [Micropruina sp.]
MTTPPARVGCAAIDDRPLDLHALAALVSDDRAGATVTFTGVIRNHDHGRAVNGIEYVGHPSADAVIATIAAELTDRDGVHSIVVAHRVGTLAVGDLALVAAVSASHRAQAFDTCSELVEQVKARLPIWKRQLFSDGTAEWSNCP